jgi:hypothetical protein
LNAGSAARLQPLLRALMFELSREIASSLPEGRVAEASQSKISSKVH